MSSYQGPPFCLSFYHTLTFILLAFHRFFSSLIFHFIEILFLMLLFVHRCFHSFSEISQWWLWWSITKIISSICRTSTHVVAAAWWWIIMNFENFQIDLNMKGIFRLASVLTAHPPAYDFRQIFSYYWGSGHERSISRVFF